MDVNTISSHDYALHVRGLAKNVTSDSLRQAFGGDAADVKSVHICVDQTTGTSLGRAYVNFGTRGAADRALNPVRRGPLQNAEVNIEWASKPSQSRHHGHSNVCIKGISRDVTEAQFMAYLNLIGGTVVSHRFPTQDANSRGYAFVLYRTLQDSRLAIEKINSTPLQGKPLFATRYLSLKERERLLSANQGNMFNSVLVENLSLDVDERALRERFRVYGNIMLTTFLGGTERSTSKSALVTYADHAAAAAAVNQHAEDTIKVSRALTLEELAECNAEKQARRRKEVAVYVRNLDLTVTRDDLSGLFARFGEVSHIELLYPNDLGERFGYVYLKDAETAERAIAELNGANLRDRQIIVEKAASRRDRVYQRFCDAAHSQRYVDPTTRALKVPFPYFYVPHVPACDLDEILNGAELEHDDIVDDINIEDDEEDGLL